MKRTGNTEWKYCDSGPGEASLRSCVHAKSFRMRRRTSK